MSNILLVCLTFYDWKFVNKVSKRKKNIPRFSQIKKIIKFGQYYEIYFVIFQNKIKC